MYEDLEVKILPSMAACMNDEGFCDNIIQGRSQIGFVIVILLGNMYTFVCRWMVNDFCFLLMLISWRWVY